MEIEKQKQQISGSARWLTLLGGSAALYYGLKRRSWFGSALAITGAGLAVRSLTGESSLLKALGVKSGAGALPYGQGIKIRRSVTVDKPAGELYRFWRGLEHLPRFMKHLESVTVLDERQSHWVATLPAGRTVEWDAEIVADRANELIGWRTINGPVDHAGSVRFENAPGGRGTIVRVQLQYNPPGGRFTAAFARLFGENPDQQIHEDLHRFKELMEAGVIATTDGQPSGRAESARRAAHETRAREEIVRRHEAVEEASEESFPASDAPSWTAGGGR